MGKRMEDPEVLKEILAHRDFRSGDFLVNVLGVDLDAEAIWGKEDVSFLRLIRAAEGANRIAHRLYWMGEEELSQKWFGVKKDLLLRIRGRVSEARQAGLLSDWGLVWDGSAGVLVFDLVGHGQVSFHIPQFGGLFLRSFAAYGGEFAGVRNADALEAAATSNPINCALRGELVN